MGGTKPEPHPATTVHPLLTIHCTLPSTLRVLGELLSMAQPLSAATRTPSPSRPCSHPPASSHRSEGVRSAVALPSHRRAGLFAVAEAAAEPAPCAAGPRTAKRGGLAPQAARPRRSGTGSSALAAPRPGRCWPRPTYGRGLPAPSVPESRSPPRPECPWSWPLRSPLGLLRLGQLALGAAFWVTVAAHKYEGAAHFALFAAVLVWLLTLALFGLSLLGRWELVPWLGSRWLLTNLVHDLALGVGLYAAATGIMGHKAKQRSFCNLPGYSQHCLYSAYLSASICGGITACLYLFSGLYCLSRRCQDQRDII